MTTFAEIVTIARQLAGMTDAEFDYSLASGDRGADSAMTALTNAAYLITTPHLPEVSGATSVEDLLRRQDTARALIDATTTEREAMVVSARTKGYTGWSVHSSGPIQYA